tara:strand:- start:948 stop:1091 length:144 start_codon:yes stop_codon:yes gene_type:complete
VARKWKDYKEHEATMHGTSIGRNPKFSSMNKSKRRSFKKYRGQGKRR